jgi:diadenosine tetraphosphate (Ap4A) HIT family hydrolase
MDQVARRATGATSVGFDTVEHQCASCGFDLWLPISGLSSSVVGLYSDDRFHGRCLVSFVEHFDSLEEMPADTVREFMTDVRLAANAVKRATNCERVNIAILGNAASHVHAHLIPRHPDREAYPDRAPWEDPRPRKKLVPSDEVWWRSRILEALDEIRRRGVSPREGGHLIARTGPVSAGGPSSADGMLF